MLKESHICSEGLYAYLDPVQEVHLHDERFLLLGGLPQRSGGAKLLETDVSDAWLLSEAPALAALATTARFSGACFF